MRPLFLDNAMTTDLTSFSRYMRDQFRPLGFVCTPDGSGRLRVRIYVQRTDQTILDIEDVVLSDHFGHAECQELAHAWRRLIDDQFAPGPSSAGEPQTT
jgi:hypothetical protein